MADMVERWRQLANIAVSDTGNVVPVELVLAIIAAESEGYPKAVRKEVKISDASIGLMQIVGSTARSLGYTGDIGNADDLSGLYDPETNIRLGTQLLTDLWTQLGNASDVASAYNGGVRPTLGFGRKYTGVNPVTICLARDQVTGKCIKSRVVHAGEYGNADYVNEVLAGMKKYTAQLLPAVVITATPNGWTTFDIVAALLILVAAFLLWQGV